MEIERFDKGNKGFFKAVENGAMAGIMTYSRKGEDVVVIEHTEVDPAFSGQGLGQDLVMEFAGFARENKLKVIPVCSFANSVFKKTEAIRDVLL